MLIRFCAILGMLALALPANAAVMSVNNWTLDLSAVAGEGLTGTVDDIDRITFNGIAHNSTNDTNGNGVTDTGERGIVDGLGRATDFIGAGSSVSTSSTGEVLDADYEFTFDFSVDTIGTGSIPFMGGILSTFEHTAPTLTSGLLNWYVDGTPDSVLNLSSGGTLVSGNQDGTLIATFQILPGGGGVISSATLDGSDDATFQLISALPGVLKDEFGNDLGSLVAGGSVVLLALTDSNFHLDDDGNGSIDSGPPAGWPFPRQGTGSPVEHFASEDGSVRLAAVPEPASIMTFLGIGAIAVGARRRRRAKV